jgi:hypothetical protein
MAKQPGAQGTAKWSAAQLPVLPDEMIGGYTTFVKVSGDLSERSNGSATVRIFQGPNELTIFNRSSLVCSFSRTPTATKLVSQCLRSIELASHNVRMDTQRSIATILEFPTTRSHGTWVPRHARPCTVDDVEFYSLKLIQHLCNVTCRPLAIRLLRSTPGGARSWDWTGENTVSSAGSGSKLGSAAVVCAQVRSAYRKTESKAQPGGQGQ